jgi:predicted MFS family arabinose efflux permease
MSSPSFPVFMVPLLFFPFVMIFTHTFVFGKLAIADPTGRAVAATPAMIMTGSAVGPFLGGALVQTFGYAALGMTALAIGVLAMGLFFMARSADA